MGWNTGASILGTGSSKTDVMQEADTIFAATFIGLVTWKAKRNNLTWRVDMEPSMDVDKGQQERTKEDRESMKRLNDVCSKVNHVVRSYYDKNTGGISWGLTPVFSRGGMIAGGDYAKNYDEFDEAFKKSAWKYLTDAASDAKGGARSESMYIGRGAYCGLVVDEQGDAITAMSTIRTTFRETGSVLLGVGVPVGDRWRPPTTSPVFSGKDQGFTWGMIVSNKLQASLREEGMRFYCENPPDPATDIVGYTHGMIRAIYECKRIGEGTPYEMSLGGKTAKLASCMACSVFMIANGYDPSSSHLGRGESWVPLYHAYGHNKSYKPDETPLLEAITDSNSVWAAHVHEWMNLGVAAMQAQPGWVSQPHQRCLGALAQRIQSAKEDDLVCCNLWLDALSYHDSDTARLDRALTYGPNPRPFCNANYDWSNNTPDGPKPWEENGFNNPFTDEELQDLQDLNT